MTRRTIKSYVSVWEFIKKEFPSFDPLRSMCDFEKALMKSIRISFPKTIIRGCYFHFAQVKKKSFQFFYFYVYDDTTLSY